MHFVRRSNCSNWQTKKNWVQLQRICQMVNTISLVKFPLLCKMIENLQSTQNLWQWRQKKRNNNNNNKFANRQRNCEDTQHESFVWFVYSFKGTVTIVYIQFFSSLYVCEATKSSYSVYRSNSGFAVANSVRSSAAISLYWVVFCWHSYTTNDIICIITKRAKVTTPIFE